MLSIIVWMIAAYVTLYTFQYAKVVYHEGNKIGSIAIGMLAVISIVLPYFIRIR